MQFGTGVDHITNTKTRESKYKMTYVRPNIYTNKQTSPIFNCVTPVSVSLATLARQLFMKYRDIAFYRDNASIVSPVIIQYHQL